MLFRELLEQIGDYDVMNICESVPLMLHVRATGVHGVPPETFIDAPSKSFKTNCAWEHLLDYNVNGIYANWNGEYLVVNIHESEKE